MLLEREPEIASVTASLRQARVGRGQLVVIGGGLGAGKSRLIHALREHALAEGVTALQASCALSERDFACGMVHQLLDSALLLALSEQRGSPFTETTENQVLENLHELVRELSGESPLLILVDDAHWADTASLDWLNRLTERLGELSIVVVVTVREGDPLADQSALREIAGRATRHLTLGPLSPGATKIAVAEEFGEPGDDSFVRSCHETSAGRPLFLMSILTDLRQLGYHPIAEHAEAVRQLLPTALRQRIMACLRSQPEPVRRFAHALAVLDERDSRDLLCTLACLAPADCAEAADSLARLGLLNPLPPHHFFHPSVLDAVEQSMPTQQWAVLHFRLAELLHGCDSPAEDVAAHLVHADHDPAPWAVEVLRSAARTTSARGEFETATRYLRCALLSCTPDDAGRAQLLVDLATAERRFDPLLSAQHLSEALPLFASTIDRCRAAVRIEPLTLGQHPGQALDLLEGLRTELGDPAELSGESHEMSLRLEARVRYARHRDPADLADAVDRLAGLGEHPPLATAGERELVGSLIFAATMSGSGSARVTELGERIVRREPATMEQVHTATPLVVRSLILADALDQAVTWLDLIAIQERRVSAPAARVFVTVQRALIAVRQGKTAEAAGLAGLALDLANHTLPSASEGCTHALVLAAMGTGDAATAARFLGRCNDYDAGGTSWLGKLVRGGLAATTGNHPVALEYFHACGRELDAAGWRNPELVPWRSWAALLHHRLGQRAAAEELIEEEHARTVEWGTLQGQGRALRVWGSITEGNAGIELLRRSAAVLNGSVNRVEQAKTGLLLGKRLEQSDPAESQRQREQGLALADEHEAPWLVPTPGEAPQAPAPRPALTCSEHRIAELAARGLTNQLIAEKVDVTPRTVEKHLTSVYRKLGVSGRGALPAAMDQLPPSSTTD
ncbi:MAG: LuxR family transcriptional regulator [Amycolatopsis sp.]|uniref:helix-turn-helix transcriptional regulator n=1 Tax=Amycolatopsis sp. TaxID=37632 RepID=UPI0026178B34|nr:LuxR family transcriptional regulator [Amycolatopsis sp.]MCU1686834.1 LuxR family transcriptional regulator [Amycolatopsis sp.]